MSVNLVILLGNFGKDPELGEGKSSYCRFSIATTSDYKGKQETTWHNLVAFGKTAEVIVQYFSKGDPIYIEGRLKTEEYQGKTNTSIIVEKFSFIGRKDN